MGPEGRGPEPLPPQGAAQQVLALYSAPATPCFVQHNKGILLRTVPFAASIHPPGVGDRGGGRVGASRGLPKGPPWDPRVLREHGCRSPPREGPGRVGPSAIPARSGAMPARSRHGPGAIRRRPGAGRRQWPPVGRGRCGAAGAAPAAPPPRCPARLWGHHGPQSVAAVQRCGGGGGGRGGQHGVQQALALQRPHPPHRGARPPGGSGRRARRRSAPGGRDAAAARAGGDTRGPEGRNPGTQLGFTGHKSGGRAGTQWENTGRETSRDPAAPAWRRGFSRVVLPRPACPRSSPPRSRTPAPAPREPGRSWTRRWRMTFARCGTCRWTR